MQLPPFQVIDNIAVIRFTERRLCRVDQLDALFAAIDRLLAQEKLSRGIISLEPLSFAREERLRQRLSEILRERQARSAPQLVWAGGRQGDARFLRSAAALARVAPRIYTTEHDALEALGYQRSAETPDEPKADQQERSAPQASRRAASMVALTSTSETPK